ncbi:MAG TPA: glutathione transferase [Kofleriaceae bacterium]
MANGLQSEQLVLYVEASWSSPWVCAVYVALREKRLSFTTARAMMRKGVGAIDHMRERTLTGTAPVLQHGEFWLAESLAIVEYLEEVFPQPAMFPRDVRDRARARQIMTWMRNEHDALRTERPAERIMYPSAGELPPLSPAARRAADDLVRVAERLGASASGAVFGQFGAIDVDLAFALMRLIKTDRAVPEPLRAYAEAVWSRPSVREFVDHERPPNRPD